MKPRPEFDEFADKYQETMARACALSGETADFYAEQRIRWCARRLGRKLPLERVLDYGCGTGGSFPHFERILGCRQIIGIDPSSESLRVAGERQVQSSVELATPERFTPRGDVPFAFCNGVFHHIAPAERSCALAYISSSLRKDGFFALWENNPWNPIVVYGMSLNDFDRNAETISAREAGRLLRAAGFRIVRTDFCFFFPKFARKLRVLEGALRWCPLGAQYLVLAQK